MTWNVIHGDCMSELRTIDSESFDAVITDPPYGIDFQSAWRPKAHRTSRIANDKRPFIWFLHDAYRVTKPGGCLVCFSSWAFGETFRSAIECAGFAVRSQIIWDRGRHGMGDVGTTVAPQHEIIWFATKGKFKFPGRRPASVIRCPRVTGVHPNEKPIALMDELVTAMCPAGGSIVDPFCGSGSTGVAAVTNGMNFVGIESDRTFCTLASDRISGSLLTKTNVA